MLFSTLKLWGMIHKNTYSLSKIHINTLMIQGSKHFLQTCCTDLQATRFKKSGLWFQRPYYYTGSHHPGSISESWKQNAVRVVDNLVCVEGRLLASRPQGGHPSCAVTRITVPRGDRCW